MPVATTLVWFRSDLRTDDQPALQAAVQIGRPLIGVYVWPPANELGGKRRYFIWQSLRDLSARLAQCGIPLHVLEGEPERLVSEWAVRCRAGDVVCSGEWRELNAVSAMLAARYCRLHVVSDGLLQQPFRFPLAHYLDETEFSAFQVAWQAACAEQYADWQMPVWPPPELSGLQSRLPESLKQAASIPTVPAATLTVNGGETAARRQLSGALPKLPYFGTLRDLPAQQGSAQISPHLRLGTLSVRRLWVETAAWPEVDLWREGLARREFFLHVFQQYPAMWPEGLPNCPAAWGSAQQAVTLDAWQQGETGYPLVDAAMRLLRHTGWLPHSLRWLCAMFFCRVLLYDWRLGADWFARQLLDFEPAVNNGNWLLAAGLASRQSDGQLFSPVALSQKLDPDGQFIRCHLPQLAHLDGRFIHAPWRVAAEVNTNGYPAPVVDYRESGKKWSAMLERRKNSAAW